MNEKTLRVLIEAGGVKKLCIIGDGSQFFVEVVTHTGKMTVNTMAGQLKQWASLDSTARWIHSLGIGKADIDLSRWSPQQRGMKL